MTKLGGHGPAVIAVLVGETAVSGAFIGLRWYTRHVIKGSLGIDDYSLAATWVFVLTYTILYVVACLNGFGEHLDNLDPPDIKTSMFTFLVAQCIACISMGLSKAAVCLFLLRLVVTVWQKVFIWFWLVTYNILSVIMAVAVFTQCTPIQALWDDQVTLVGCSIHLTTLAIVVCAWSVAIDFALAILPWYFLWGLNMPRKEKLSICISLSLGVLAGVCGIVRTVGLNKLDDSDTLYSSAEPVMWTASETFLTILCVTIPSLRPLFRRVFRGYVDYSSVKRSNGKQGSRSGAFGAGNSDAIQLDTVVRANINRNRDPEANNVWKGDHIDSGSDKSILVRPQEAVIQKTQEISISYSIRN